MTKIKVKTFSRYNLIDVNDLHKKVYKHLLKTKQEFCFVEGEIITRDKCKRY